MTRRTLLMAAVARRDESFARLLERTLPVETEYLLRRIDGAAVALRWDSPREPAPLGSIVKPFVALAYGGAHGFRYPEFDCAGCWLPRGHGRIGMAEAIVVSCNSYFEQLAAATPLEAVQREALRYALPMPREVTPGVLIGRYGTWRAKPAVVAAAYGELAARRDEVGVGLVLNAMMQCARRGTASGLRARVAAKTGTVPCAHVNPATGDGLVVALFPSESPEFVLLLRAHAMPGAECARVAAPFFRVAL